MTENFLFGLEEKQDNRKMNLYKYTYMSLKMTLNFFLKRTNNQPKKDNYPSLLKKKMNIMSQKKKKKKQKKKEKEKKKSKAPTERKKKNTKNKKQKQKLEES